MRGPRSVVGDNRMVLMDPGEISLLKKVANYAHYKIYIKRLIITYFNGVVIRADIRKQSWRLISFKIPSLLTLFIHIIVTDLLT